MKTGEGCLTIRQERLGAAILKRPDSWATEDNIDEDVNLNRYLTACGISLLYIDDGPKAADHRFCPGCGRLLDVKGETGEAGR